MVRVPLCLLLLAWFGMIQAVSYQPGTGVQTQPDPGREYDFHYHSGTDDYHFYGTDAWAVRFDFRE
ncbi:MAG TPA: hypothetical protein PKH19_00590, partial [Candidatus Syntrophosphaera sp.]|nr:hypothetical protein [Candidatus Syntrophosphaera sp.]